MRNAPLKERVAKAHIRADIESFLFYPVAIFIGIMCAVIVRLLS